VYGTKLSMKASTDSKASDYYFEVCRSTAVEKRWGTAAGLLGEDQRERYISIGENKKTCWHCTLPANYADLCARYF